MLKEHGLESMGLKGGGKADQGLALSPKKPSPSPNSRSRSPE